VLIEKFVSQMLDKSWLVERSSVSPVSDGEIIRQLWMIRNDISHQLSLPNDLGMANTKAEASEIFIEHTHIVRVICVVEFIDAVSSTIQEIFTNFSSNEFDPSPRNPRSPAEHVVLPSGTSGSLVPGKTATTKPV
jgi:hypothetical protein